MQRSATTLDGYLGQLTPAERAELEPLAARITAALPDAQPGFDWGMPVWKAGDGTMLAGIAAQRNNLALYLGPQGAEDLFAPWRDRLPRSAIGKSCLRFRSLARLPAGLIDELLELVARRSQGGRRAA